MKTKCLLMLLVVFSCAVSFAGGPAPNNFILQIQNAGSPVVTTSSFIRLNCSTNVTCSLSGGTVNITASSTASTAWTAITAGTNAGQALLIGAGGSLGVTAGGIITASAAPWSGLTGFPSACTNQAVTGVGASLTCTTVTSAYVDTSIAKTGTDINTSNQVTVTHLASALPVAQGGIGVGTLTGLAKGNGTSAFTAAASTDVTALWSGTCSASTFLRGDGSCQTPAGSGTVTGATFTGGLISVSGSTTLAFTVAGTSGGVPYFGSASTWLSSGIMASGQFMLGGGAGASPTTSFSVVPVANGGIGVGTLTGLAKGNGVSAFTAAASADVIALWSGTCSASTFLRGDGSCQATSGSAPGGSNTQLQYNNSTAFGGVSGWTTNGTTTMTGGATSVLDLSAMAPVSGLKLPSVAGAVPTADGFIGINITTHTLVYGINGTTGVSAIAATGTNTATTCSSQVVTAVSGIAIPTCTTLTTAFLPSTAVNSVTNDTNVTGSIATQALTLGWSGTLAVSRGGIGIGTLTGLVKGNGTSAFTAAASADVYALWSGTCSSSTFLRGDGSCQTPAGSGTINSGTTDGLTYYTGATAVSSTTPPTVNGSYLCGYVVTASAAVAPTCTFPGVAVDATNPAILLYTDRESYLQWTVGSTLTLPAAATNFATNFPFVIQNTSGGALALTPTTPNNIDGGSSQATSSVPNNYAAFVYQDATPNWQTIKFPTLAAFGTCVDTGGNHLNISSTGVFSCGTSSSGGSTAFSSLTGGTNSAAAMVIGTGASLTVSGSGTNNATSVNGNTFPASVGLTSGGLLYASSTSAVGSSALLATNSPIIGGGAGTAPKTVAGLLFDGTSKLTTGQSGTSAGNYCMANLTSGTICFAPVTGALGSAVITTPAATDTMALLAATQTFTNKSISLQQLTSATGAVGPWANGNNPLVINCALTSGTTCMTVGEATASTSVGSFGLRVTTLAGSDSTPLEVDNSLTGSQALATVSIIPTWNTSAGPSALVINPTNTASGAGALLIQAELSSVNKFTVDKSGNIVAAGSITVTSCSGCGSGLPSAAINTVAVGPTDVPGGSATTMTAVASPTPLYFVDPRAWIYIFDEFTNVPGTGISQWTVGGTGGTASWVANQTGTAYGVYACTTLAASSDACYATLNANSTGFNGSFNGFTKGDLIFRIKLTQTTNTNFFAGLIDINTQHGESSPSVVGIGYNVGKSDTGWMCVLGSASTYTRTATAGTLDTNWHDLRIRFTSAGHISCSIDQGAETAISTNFPTSTNMTPTISIDNNASANVAAYQGDYMLMAIGAAR